MRYLIFAGMFFIAACSPKKDHKKMDKLSGLWQADSGEGTLYEEWTKRNDDRMYGKSYMINGSDSMVFERVELVKSDSGMFYIPTVKDENESRPVSFKMIVSTDSSFVFENKQHDFPQRIIYRFVTPDSLVARIEGDKKGTLEFREYFYSRVKK